MRKPRQAAVSYGPFILRKFGTDEVGLVLPRPLARKMGLKAGAKLTFKVKDGGVRVHMPSARILTRGELYRVSAGWPEMRRALRRSPVRRRMANCLCLRD